MQSLNIARGFRLPADLVTQTAAVLARKGAGKTYTASVMAEELLEARQQVVVIDPLDAWWGLRSSADGRRDGYPVAVFGDTKRHADLPLEPATAERLADLVAENAGLSCVLSLRHLRKNRQREFVMRFAEQLFHRKGDPKLATPVHVFVDESDLFVPQRVMGDTARLVGAMEDLVRRGRQAGIGITMISQRPASINKDVLTQIELLIVGQLTGPHDKKAIRAWIEENADDARQHEFMKSLAELEVGSLWFWSPAWLSCLKLVQVRTRRTFDSSATPKAGAKLRSPKRAAPVDLDKVRRELADVIERTEENDPKKLRQRIAQLEKELRKKAPAPPPPPPREPEITCAEVEALVAEAIEQRDVQWEEVSERWRLMKPEQRCEAFARHLISKRWKRSQKRTARCPAPAARPKHQPIESHVGEAFDPALSKCERAVLTVLVQREVPCSKKLIAIQAGYSVTSGGFGQALADLRKKGYVNGGSGAVTATEAGARALGPCEELPRGRDLLDYWIGRLPKAQAKILEILQRFLPEPVNKFTLAEETGYSMTSGGFGQALADLRKLRLISGGSNAITISSELEMP